MADIVREVAVFDFDTDKATRQANQYIKNLERLDAELVKLQKEGKDTTEVQKQITASTAALNRALSQETKTLKGTTAQLKVTTKASQRLNTQQNKQLQTSKKLERQTKSLGGAFKSSLRDVRKLRFGIGAAVGIFVASFDAISDGIDKVVNSFFPLIAATNAANDATREAASSFVEEKAVLDTLLKTAGDKTASDETRQAAINKLNDEYKTYLPNLGDEVKLQAALVTAGQKANAVLIEGIAARAKAEFAKAQIEALVDSVVNEKEIEDLGESTAGNVVDGLGRGLAAIFSFGITELTGVGEDVTFTGVSKALNEIDREAAKANLGEEALAAFEARVKEVLGEAADSGVDFTKATNKTIEEILGTTTEGADKQATALKGSLAFLRKQLGEVNKLIEEGTKIGDIEALTKLTSQSKDLNTQIEAAEKTINDLLNPPPPSGTLQDLKNQLQAINQELTKETPLDNQEKVNELIEKRKRLTDEIRKAEELLSGVRKKLATTEIESLNAGEEARKKRLEEIKVAIEQEEIANLKLLQNIEAQRQAALTAEGVVLAERAGINEDFLNQREEQERKSQQTILQLQIAQLQIQRQIAAQNQQNTAAIDKQIEELRLNLQELQGESIKLDVDIDVEDAESKLEKTKEIVANVASAVEELGGQILGFLAQQATAQIGRLDEAVAKQKSVLNELIGNQSEANATQVQLERDRLDKLEERRQKALERERAIGLAQIAVNSAVAIARAAAEGGGFASAITIAATLIALAFGFAQARAQANQAFYDGTTYVRRGPGEKPGRDTVKAYLNEGEAVIPTQTNKKYSGAIKAIYGNKVNPKLMNDFAELAQNSSLTSLQDLSKLGILPPSLLKVMDSEGISLSGGADMSGVVAKLGELGALRKEVAGLREELAAIPRNTYNFTERGLTKVVSRGMENNSKLRNKYR